MTPATAVAELPAPSPPLVLERPEHTIEIVSDAGEGAQKCGQIFGAVSAKMGNGVWTVEIIPAVCHEVHQCLLLGMRSRSTTGAHRRTDSGRPVTDSRSQNRLPRDRRALLRRPLSAGRGAAGSHGCTARTEWPAYHNAANRECSMSGLRQTNRFRHRRSRTLHLLRVWFDFYAWSNRKTGRLDTSAVRSRAARAPEPCGP